MHYVNYLGLTVLWVFIFYQNLWWLNTLCLKIYRWACEFLFCNSFTFQLKFVCTYRHNHVCMWKCICISMLEVNIQCFTELLINWFLETKISHWTSNSLIIKRLISKPQVSSCVHLKSAGTTHSCFFHMDAGVWIQVLILVW